MKEKKVHNKEAHEPGALVYIPSGVSLYDGKFNTVYPKEPSIAVFLSYEDERKNIGRIMWKGGVFIIKSVDIYVLKEKNDVC